MGISYVYNLMKTLYPSYSAEMKADSSAFSMWRTRRITNRLCIFLTFLWHDLIRITSLFFMARAAIWAIISRCSLFISASDHWFILFALKLFGFLSPSSKFTVLPRDLLSFGGGFPGSAMMDPRDLCAFWLLLGRETFLNNEPRRLPKTK